MSELDERPDPLEISWDDWVVPDCSLIWDPGLLMNFDFARLSIASKGTLLLIWLLQADRGGPVQISDLADHMFPAGYQQLEALVDAGFIELTDTGP